MAIPEAHRAGTAGAYRLPHLLFCDASWPLVPDKVSVFLPRDNGFNWQCDVGNLFGLVDPNGKQVG